ncbi:MAG: FG-GAP-like repeat-containing protein [Candidatus Hinthialibacter antarcticus]|nr:FG-GAP-like repeat-containing protein [Candidatus Hinthialibacter antarcticus]
MRRIIFVLPVFILLISTENLWAQYNQSLVVDELVTAIESRNPQKGFQALDAIQAELIGDDLRNIDAALQKVVYNDSWMEFVKQLYNKANQHSMIGSQLSRCYCQTDRVEDGITLMKQMVAEDSNNLLLLHRACIVGYSNNQFEDANLWIARLLELEPGHIDALFLKGAVLSKEGKYDEARRILLEVVRLEPNHRLVFYELGLLENLDNKPEKAEQYLRKVIQIQPFHQKAYNQLLLSLSRQKKKDELEKVRAIGAYLNDWGKSKLVRIFELFNRQNALSPQETLEISLEYCQVGRNDLAYKHLTRLVENGNANNQILLLLGQIEYIQKRFEKSLAYLKIVSDKRMRSTEYYMKIVAGSLFALKRYEECEKIVVAALSVYPESEPLKALKKMIDEIEASPTTMAQAELKSASTEESKQVTADSGEKNKERSNHLKKGALKEVAPGKFHFVDASEQSGLMAFQHRLGHPDKRWILDAMGSGVAVGDYDNDGDDDIYFSNGRPDAVKPDSNFRNYLFRNDQGQFVDVTLEAGVGDLGYSMGAVFGDVNNDGWLDLYVGNFGRNTLYINKGDGTFHDATDSAGVGDGGYCAALTVGDFNKDGFLDIYAGNYVDFDPVRDAERRGDFYGVSVFVHPLDFDAQPDRMYFNQGDGTFKDVMGDFGLNSTNGRAMGAVAFDMENDGDLDLYVTNDTTYNFVFQNNNGFFEDVSYFSGGAFTANGQEHASMGMSPGDYDNDGFMDLFVTSYVNQTDLIYRNDGKGMLHDVTGIVGLLNPSFLKVTWGTNWCDFNADGWLDVFTANGHIYPQVDEMDLTHTYRQGVSFYQNLGKQFIDVTGPSLPSGIRMESGRGSAMLDFDNDGDMDIVVNCIDAKPVLLENKTQGKNWLNVKLLGSSAQTYGVRVVARKSDNHWTRIVDGGSSYISQSTSTLHFGFGDYQTIDELTVYWNHAAPTVIQNPTMNSLITIGFPK